VSLLAGAAGVARRLEGIPGRARVGRSLGRDLARLGADPVITVAFDDGVFVLDARSRTEAGRLWAGHRDDDDVAFLRTVTPPDGTFLDIGANVGRILIPMLGHLSAAGGALAVEPVPVNAARLRSAISLNQVSCHVEVHEVALGAASGLLWLDKEGPAASSGNAVARPSGGHEAAMTTLDEFCATAGVSRLDVIKIDVEGFEVEVFRGGQRTLGALRPVVFGEFNNTLLPARGQTFDDAWAIFAPLGYRCFSFLARLRLVERVDPPPDLGNVVLVPEERVRALGDFGLV
jgi:FkbM family methyltransferase